MQAELVSMEEKLKSPVLSEDAQAELKQKFREMQGELIEFVGRAKEAEEKENQALSGRILEGEGSWKGWWISPGRSARKRGTRSFSRRAAVGLSSPRTPST
jgi:hypothetical protein